MHPHLHTKDSAPCEELANALEECSARGFLWRCAGMCTKPKHALNMCLRATRIERTAKNRDEAKLKREEIKKTWAEIDANS
ncbi:cytochrome c oxidase biogenesis protein Cmc1-like protein [Phyllosticta citriasiana]|uniref:COX assembly mitochondrial protein n=1 Tax=Phyllosticta citriasiana TaxID=595635 RepID=A0ABR1KUT6_9PEZI